jgi:small-conductance mechanosensitive channel
MKTAAIGLLWIIISTISPAVSFAQPAAPPAPSQAGSPGRYPVELDQKPLFYVSDKIEGGISSTARARNIAARIKTIADDPSIKPDSLRTINYALPITMITAGEELLMAVVEDDARLAGRSRQEYAAEISQKMGEAIEQYRKEHSLRWILQGAVYTLIATLVLIAILYFFNRLYRKASARLQTWVNVRIHSIHIQSLEIIQAERLNVLLLELMQIVRLCLVLVILYAYLHLVLGFFPWTRPFADRLLEYMFIPVKKMGSGIGRNVPNIIFLAVLTLVIRYVLKLMRLFFTGVEKGTIALKNFDPDWAQPTYKICRFLVIAFAVVVAFPYIPGSDSPAFKGISIFLGVLFSLGSSSAIANIIAGYMMTYRRAFKVGDRIKIEDVTGDVTDVRLQVTHIHTVKNEEIIVPNSTILNSHVINFSTLAREKGLILHTTVTIGYDAPWRQVHALLLMAAEKTDGVLREPAPFVLQKSLDDFYITYELNAYTNEPQRMSRTYSDLHQNIQDAFNEYGVQIMSPNYEADRDKPTFVPKDQWYAAPARKP